MPSWAWFAQSGSPRYAGNARTPAKTVALCPRAQRGMVSNLGLERCSLLRYLVARQSRRRQCAFCDAYGLTLDIYGARPGRTDDHRPRLARGCRGRCAWEMLIAVDDDWRRAVLTLLCAPSVTQTLNPASSFAVLGTSRGVKGKRLRRAERGGRTAPGPLGVSVGGQDFPGPDEICQGLVDEGWSPVGWRGLGQFRLVVSIRWGPQGTCGELRLLWVLPVAWLPSNSKAAAHRRAVHGDRRGEQERRRARRADQSRWACRSRLRCR